MIALDTNVVVRLLVDDDPGQTRRARRLVESRKALIVPSVLLETEWVLRGAYRIERATIAASVRKLLGLPNVMSSHSQAIAQALDWFEKGLDFADALHVSLAEEAEQFATFDARLAKRATAITGRRVSAL
ncbi:MAG: type II toxin-antitoxin system VapC family toxin [Betaproteobacteria bacterium]